MKKSLWYKTIVLLLRIRIFKIWLARSGSGKKMDRISNPNIMEGRVVCAAQVKSAGQEARLDAEPTKQMSGG